MSNIAFVDRISISSIPRRFVIVDMRDVPGPVLVGGRQKLSKHQVEVSSARLVGNEVIDDRKLVQSSLPNRVATLLGSESSLSETKGNTVGKLTNLSKSEGVRKKNNAILSGQARVVVSHSSLQESPVGKRILGAVVRESLRVSLVPVVGVDTGNGQSASSRAKSANGGSLGTRGSNGVLNRDVPEGGSILSHLSIVEGTVALKLGSEN